MFARFMPKEGRFFEMFDAIAVKVVEGSVVLCALLGDIEQLPTHIRKIEGIEKDADAITHAVFELLHKTFITPLDREDIHALANGLDDILDTAEGCAQMVYQYDVHVITPEAKKLGGLCLEASERVKEAVALLPNMENAQKILELCKEIGRIEDETDNIMRAAMARLFREEPDVRQMMKMRAIYEKLEDMADRAYAVATILEGIVFENA